LSVFSLTPKGSFEFVELQPANMTKGAKTANECLIFDNTSATLLSKVIGQQNMPARKPLHATHVSLYQAQLKIDAV